MLMRMHSLLLNELQAPENNCQVPFEVFCALNIQTICDQIYPFFDGAPQKRVRPTKLSDLSKDTFRTKVVLVEQRFCFPLCSFLQLSCVRWRSGLVFIQKKQLPWKTIQ